MKKLVCLALVFASLFCASCSLFDPGGSADSQTLAGKLQNVTPAREAAATPGAEEAYAPAALPDSLTFSDIDPYDFLHNGWTLTEEQALAQYGMELYGSGVDAIGVIDPLPGTLSGEVGGTLEFGSEPWVYETLYYDYELDEDAPPENALQLFRLAVAAADAEFQGRNKVWGGGLANAGIDFDTASDQELLDFVFEGDGTIRCSWGVFMGDSTYDRPCIVEIYLYELSDYFYRMNVDIRFDVDVFGVINRDRIYFPDDFPEETEPAATPAPENTQSGSSSGSSGSSGGGVYFSGLVLTDEGPYEEGLVQLADYGATSNGSGGYNCYVTIYNGTPDMTKIALDAWLYGGYEEADIITLAEPAAFHSGDSNTFYFDITYPPASGDWEVVLTYRFW